MTVMRFPGLLFVLCLLLPVTVFAESSDPVAEETVDKLPLYEYGLVGLAASLPHYRGSLDYQLYVFPLPYFVYRGEVIKANREGLRGIFWKSEKFETDLSLSGNPPVNGDDRAREGMPELDGLIEAGPALRYYFYEYGDRDALYLQTSLRAAFSIDFDDGLGLSHEGTIAEFSIAYKNSRLLKKQNSRFHLSGGLLFGDSDFHSYFYEVKAQYASQQRSEYESEGGYGGLYLAGGIIRELTPRLWLGFYGRWLNSNGAVFEDSPLVETNNNLIVGTMLTWKIGQSKRLQK